MQKSVMSASNCVSPIIWIACIPRQRHSNRPWYSLVKPAGGGEGGLGLERSHEEMKWTWLGVCFIFSCKYKSKWREWRSLGLLNYFYCSEKNKEWMVTLDAVSCYFSEKDHRSVLKKQLISRRILDWIDRLEWPSDSVSRGRGGKKSSTVVCESSASSGL